MYADENDEITIYEGTSTREVRTDAAAFSESNILPGDTYDKEYLVVVNHNGMVTLNYCGILEEQTRSIINYFDINVEYYVDQIVIEPEPEENPEPAPFSNDPEQYISATNGFVNLNQLVASAGRTTNNPVQIPLDSKGDVSDEVHFRITFKVPDDIEDCLKIEDENGNYVYNENTIQDSSLSFTSRWWVDVEDEPSPYHPDDPGHLIPETGIFGLRYTKKQETVFLFFLALLILLIIIMYKYFKRKHDEHYGN